VELSALAVLVALLQYLVIVGAVGWARGRYKVTAPAVTGNEMFERYLRVQQNTVELLVAFVPACLLFGAWVSDAWAAVLGLLFVVGRALYFVEYVRAPRSRGPGFGLSFLAVAALVMGALYGTALELL